jgi:hypothetical protein
MAMVKESRPLCELMRIGSSGVVQRRNREGVKKRGSGAVMFRVVLSRPAAYT